MSATTLRPPKVDMPKENKNPNEKKYKIVPSNILTSFIIGTLSGVCAGNYMLKILIVKKIIELYIYKLYNSIKKLKLIN